MKKIIRNSALVSALLLGLLASANAFSAGFRDRVLVIVNEDVITQSEFDYRMRSVIDEYKSKNQAPPPQLAKQLLDSMVNDRLQVQEANRRGIKISDAELEQAIERFANQQQVTVSTLKQTLRDTGQAFNMFRQSVRDSLTISRFTEFYARSRVVVPDYEIDGWLAANKLDVDNSEYQIAQILIKNSDQSPELAEQVRSEIDNGTSFGEAALKYSEAGNAQEGGLIGWRRSEQLPEVFLTAVKDMQVGQVSEVLVTPNGLHIIKLLDLKSDRTEIIQSKVSHILIKSESKVAKSQAAKRLYEIRQRVINGEDFSDLARIYSDDTGSAANGGSLDWVSPGDMVKPFEAVFQQLPLGDVSEPVETQFGMHIILVEDRRKKNITEQMVRARADNILRRQRAEREFGQWVRELLEGAYVEHVAEPALPTS